MAGYEEYRKARKQDEENRGVSSQPKTEYERYKAVRNNDNTQAVARVQINSDYINNFRNQLSQAYNDYQNKFGNYQYNTQDTYKDFLDKYQNQFSDSSYLKYIRALRELQQAGAISDADRTDMLKNTADMSGLTKSVKNMSDYMSQFKNEDEYNKSGKYALQYSGASQNEISNRLKAIRSSYKTATGEDKQALQREYNWLKDNLSGKSGTEVRKAWLEDNEARIAEINEELKTYYNTHKSRFTKEELAYYQDLENEKDSLVAETNKYKRGSDYSRDLYSNYTSNSDYSTLSKQRKFNDSIINEQEILNRLDPSNYVQAFDGKVYDSYGNEVTEESRRELQNRLSSRDKLGIFLGATDDEKRQAAIAEDTVNGGTTQIINEGLNKNWKYLEDDEIDMYYYLFNKEGQASAEAYLDTLDVELGRRDVEAMTEKLRNPASTADLERIEEINERIAQLKNDDSYQAKQELKSLTQEKNQINRKNLLAQAWDNVESVAGNIYGGIIGSVDNLVHQLRGEDINPYSVWHRASNYSQAVRATTAEDFDNMLTDKNGEPIKILGIGLSDVYQSVMSMADMYAGAVLMGGAGGYGLSMGAGAMESTARDLFEQGASGQDIFWGALLAGVAENFFEKFSLENLLSIKDTRSAKEWIKNILKQSFTEGSEEFFTEVANNITDMFVRGTQSNAMQNYYSYRDNGDQPNTATWKALRDVGIDAWKAFVGGAISGGLGGMGRSGSQLMQYNSQMNQQAGRAVRSQNAQGIYDTAQEKSINYSSAEQAYNQFLENQSAKNESRAVSETSKVLKQIDQTRRSENIADITERLTEKGISEKRAKKIASTVSDVLERGYFTEEDDKVFRNDRGTALQVINDIATGKDISFDSRNLEYGLRTGGYTQAADRVANQREAGAMPKLSFEGTVNGQSSSFTFDHIDGDTLYVKTSDGQVVKADDVQTTNRDTIQVMQDSTLFGENGAKAYLNAYDGSNASTYRQTFTAIYNQTRSGVDINTAIAEAMSEGVPEKLARIAAYTGENAYMAVQRFDEQAILKYFDKTEAEKILENLKQTAKGQESEIEQENKAAEEKDLSDVKEKYKKTFEDEHVRIKDVDWSKLDSRKQESIAGITMFIRALDRDVVIEGSLDYKNGNVIYRNAANAYFDPADNSYHFNVSMMDNAYFNVAIHESIHDLAKNNKAAYLQIRDKLIELCNNDTSGFMEDFAVELDRLMKADPQGDVYDIAYEEWVANTVSGIIADADTFSQFADRFMDEDTRSTFLKLIDAIIDYIKEAFDKIKTRLGWRQTQVLENDLNALQEVRELLLGGYQGIRNSYDIENQSEDTRGKLRDLSKLGVEVDDSGAAHYNYSARTWGHSEAELQKMVDALVAAGFDEEYSKGWVADIDSVYSLVMENQKALLYENDERYSWLKKNSEYSQGSIDFNNNCPKRVEFTALFDRLLKEFPNSVLTDQDFETIRGIMKKNGIVVTCGICFVEDRRQALGTVAQKYIDQLKDGTLAPTFKNLTKGDTYIPTQYDLITYEGFYNLWKNHPGVYESFRQYNNHRGMASIRLVEGIGEYNNQIQKYTKRTVQNKNNKGGLRIWSTSDADPRTMLDVMQIVNDAAAKGLQIQGYTKKPWFAKLVKDTGIRLLRSHIPAGIGYETINGKEVLTVDNVEGINTKDRDYEDMTDNPYIGNNIIGINDHQIRLAMLDPKFDQIIPFHSNQKKSVLEKKGIGHYNNYKLEQTEKVGYYSEGKGEVGKQVNIYTQVIKEFEKRGQPIQNKYDFVNAYLQVCKEKDLCPVFCRFLDKNENGDYTYTEGYHKFLVDYKMFDKEGNYIPQVAVKPQFDAAFATEVLKRYVRIDEAINKSVDPVVREDVYSQIKDAMQDKLRYSVNVDSEGNELSDGQQEFFAESKVRDEEGHLQLVYHGSPATDITVFDRNLAGRHTESYQDKLIWFTDNEQFADDFSHEFEESGYSRYRVRLGAKGRVYLGYLNMKNPFDLTNPTEEMKDYLARNQARMFGGDVEAARAQVDRLFEYGNHQYLKIYINNYDELRNMGYDGIIARTDTYNHKSDALEYGVFESNQFKSVDNKSPSESQDIRYSTNTDSTGKQLTEEQDEYFKDSKVRDNEGNLKVMYHGTNAEFNIFDQVNFGENGDTAEGFGIYLTDSKEVADSYGGRIIEAYANVTRPASKNAKTIKRAELVKLIKATCEREAQSMLDDYDSVEEALKDTWISNYTYTYDKPITAAYNQVATDILRMNDNDMDIVQEVMAGMAIRDYAKAYEFYPLLTETTGIDGFETVWEDSRDPDNPAHIVVAFNSNQVKNTDNLNPTSSDDIRYSAISDPEMLDYLEDQEHVTVYRAMAMIDGELYPPMATKIKNAVTGKYELQEPTKIGTWYQSEERPDLVKNGKFTLNKDNGTSVDAAYNPYWHTSLSVLNDQFTSAYKRDNLVVVQGEVPASELTSGYQAEGAKDPVGKTEWHSGTVSSDLKKAGKNAREVILSRYFKPTAVLSDAEVAQGISELVSGTNVEIPFNVVTPGVRAELEKLGVPIGDSRGLKEKLSKDINNKETEYIPVEERQFTYDELISKPDMYIVPMEASDEYSTERESKKQLFRDAKSMASKYGHQEGTASYVYIPDTRENVIVGTRGLEHGMEDYRFNIHRKGALNIGGILHNSILVNRLYPRTNDKQKYSDVYFGLGRDGEDYYLIRSIVHAYEGKLISSKALGKFTLSEIKEELAALGHPVGSTPHAEFLSTIKISDLLNLVNTKYADILPETVYKHFGHDQRPRGDIGTSAMYSANNDFSSLNNSDKKNVENLKQTIGDQYRLTVGKQMTMPAAEKIARDVTRRTNSTADKAALATELKDLFDDAARQGKDLDTDAFIEAGTKIMRGVLEKSGTFDQTAYDNDEPLRKYLKETGISLNELQQGEAKYLFESVANYRRALFGSVLIKNSGIPLDVAWQELNKMSSYLFPSDVNDGDMVSYLYDAAKALSKANYYVNEYGFDLDGAAAYEFAQIVGDYTENKRIKTFVQQLRTYGKRYLDNEMKEIRKTRREKMAIQSRLYEEQRKRNASLKVEISNLERQLSGEAQDIQRDITFLQSRLKNVQPGVDEFALREQIADLEQDKANLEERYRAEIKSKTDELQQGQEELEKIGREYVKAGSTSATLALDARKAAIGTKSAVKLRAQKEAQEIRTLQNNIRKKSSNLMSRLISGTDTKHVPENLREAVTGFLQAVDLGWNQGTLAAEKWLSDLNVLADKMAAANEVNGNFQVDDMIISQLREMGARITERLSLAGKNLRTMSIAELNQLDDALSLVNAAIYNSDRLLADDRKQRASAVAERSITEMGKKKQRKHTKDLLGRVGNFFTLDQLDSFSYAERIGGPFKDVIFRNLRKAFDKKVQLVQQGIDAYRKAASVFGNTEKSILSKIRSMSGVNAQTKTFDLESGKKLTLNTAQIMELYLLNERDQARIHLYNGGITVEEYKAKDGTVKKQEFIKVTEDDIDRIIGTLTKEQKQFANELQKYASSNMSEWGNDVSMTLWGVKKFIEQNYWPITVDDNTTDAVSQDKKNGNVGLYHLKNIGMSKAVNPKANNALVIGDVIDTYIRHVDEMTSYAAYTIPLDDAMKWYNYKNGNQTVQRSIESLMGKGGKAWFTDFIRALNNAQDMTGGMDFADTMIRNAKVAAIAANLRVIIQQPSAFARAIEAIDPKYLLNVNNLNVMQGAREAQEHSSIARWKNWGFRDVNVGGNLRSLMVGDDNIFEKAREKASIPAGKFDDATWGALWNACKAEIEDKRQDLEKGSEEYWQAISDRFAEVIDRTQVVDSPFHRSKAMRSKNALWKMYTSFMSEPTKTYNMFYKTISNAYQGNWSAETRKAVARATFAFAAATVLNSVLAAIIDVGRDTDDEDWWEKYLKNMGKNMLDGFNPLNLIPIGKDIVSIFDGYEASRMDLDAVSDLIKQLKRAGSTLSGEKDYNVLKIVYDSAMALSKITGIPAGNVWREINSLLNLAGVDVSVFKGTWNNTNAKAVAEDMYSYFAKGDMAGFQRVFDKYVEDEVSKMVEEDTKTLEETGQHKYDSTESMQNKATKAVLNKLAQQLADNEEQIAEAYLAKTIGDGSEVVRIRNEYIAKGIPEEVFDKAVNLYGSSMNVQPEGVNELNSKLYSYDDLYAAIESGDLEDIGYIYDEMIEDSQAVNPEEYISNKAVKEFRDKYYEYVGSGQTAKASQLENTLEQAFGLTSEDLASYKTGYQKYAFVQKAGPDSDDITTAAITTYNTVLKGLGITESTWYDVWKFKNTTHADVDKNGKSIDGSLRDKIFAYINTLPVSDAQKNALAKACGYGDSSIAKNKPW